MLTRNPPRLLIIPNDASGDSSISTLAHSRTSNPSRYYFDPKSGVYEFTRVAAPRSSCRSWLISPQFKTVVHEGEANGKKEPEKLKDVPEPASLATMPSPDHSARPISDGFVNSSAELLIATPIDYLFLVIPALCDQLSTKSTSSSRLFLSADDLLDKLSEQSPHFNQVCGHGPARIAIVARMEVVCDSVDAGDQKMYRLSEGKLLNELIEKAKQTVAAGLPPSMEEKFVRRALETPVMAIKREDSSVTDNNPNETYKPVSETTSSDAMESQASTATLDSAISALSSSSEVTIPDESNQGADAIDLPHLLRLRTVLLYMMTVYLPLSLAAALNIRVASTSCPIDFKPLDQHLACVATMRTEALASRSLGDFSRKRNMHEEDDAAETRAEKKRKREEEEKRKKAGESRGIRDLKKVDTKGMKKMSDFFSKGAAPKKK